MAKPILLKDRYLLLEELGQGGFGQTYLAEDTHWPSRRRCVVKHLYYKDDDSKTDALIRQRFEREAALLEQLSESIEQIPKLYAYFSEANELFIVEEWIEGETLQSLWNKQPRFSEEEVAKLLLEKEVVERPALQAILKESNGACGPEEESKQVLNLNGSRRSASGGA